MNKRYTQSFKQEAVDLALHSEKPAYKIAQDLGINEKTFYNWMAQSMKNTKHDKAKQADKLDKKDYQALERENRAMKKELEIRKKEIEFLKKASAYFAKHHK